MDITRSTSPRGVRAAVLRRWADRVLIPTLSSAPSPRQSLTGSPPFLEGEPPVAAQGRRVGHRVTLF
jgi:hypothetical protein